MKFSIIYEFECPMTHSVKQYQPSQLHLFDCTEKTDGEPSKWCGDLWDGQCKHRKYCGILNRDQFERFLQDTGLFADSTETMGSLGAPGFGVGWAPAIAFSNDGEAIQSAYVTPFPSFTPKTGISNSEKNWNHIRAAILNQY